MIRSSLLEFPFEVLGAVERASTALARVEVASEPGGTALAESLVRRQAVLLVGGGEGSARSLLLEDDTASARPARNVFRILGESGNHQAPAPDLLNSIDTEALTPAVRDELLEAIALERHQPALLRAAIAFGCVAASPPVTPQTLQAAALLSDRILAEGGLTRRSRLSPGQLDAATRSAAVQVERSGAWLEWIRAWCLLLARESAVVERAVRGALTELAAQRTVARALHRVGATDELVLAHLQGVSSFTIPTAVGHLGVSAPTVGTSIERLEAAGVAVELTGQKRDRIWVSSTLLRLSSGR